MALEMTPDARPYQVDATHDGALARDLDHVAQALNTRDVALQQAAHTMQATQEQIARLVEQNQEYSQRIEGLETAARAALDAITTDAANRLAQTVERTDMRVMEALSVQEQQQRELARWRDDSEERLRAQLRDLGEWDEALIQVRHEIGGLREMAEASVSLASGDLERRWDALRRELRDVLATTENDERARWEAFMASAGETLASHSGIDLAEFATVRNEITTLRDAANRTISQLQQAQRDQLEALRSEMRTLLESERSSIGATVEQKQEEARRVFLAQVQALQDWQQQVGRDVAVLKTSAQAAEEGVRAAKTTLHTETQHALTTIRNEVEFGVAQARMTAQNEVGNVRADCERLVQRAQRQTQSRQTVTFILTTLALLLAAGALLMPLLHH
jgi:hypothetical protein